MDDFVMNGESPTVILKKIIIQVPVKKPNKQKFFKVLSGPEWEILVTVLELREEGEYYLVTKNIAPYIIGEVKLVRLNLAYYLDGTPFLIPIPMPEPDNPSKWNSWHRSLDTAVKTAMRTWIRAIPDKSSNGYILMEAMGKFQEPILPKDLTLKNYMEIGFRGRIISELDHPVIKHLMGQGHGAVAQETE